MSSGVFQRKEIKYLLDSRQRSALEQAMAAHMKIDEYGESTICSLYYDTPDYRLIRRSLDKPEYKEKLRLRSYGTAAPGSDIFVELKKKYNGVVYKRRVQLPEDQVAPWLAGQRGCPRDSQIGREVDWFVNYYGTLRPAMYLCYDRTAWFCPADADLRVTFDRNIRWRTDNLSLTVPPWGEQLLAPGQSLLEIKAAAGLPLWLTAVLSKNQIRQISFSKYGSAYTLLTERERYERGGISCA